MIEAATGFEPAVFISSWMALGISVWTLAGAGTSAATAAGVADSSSLGFVCLLFLLEGLGDSAAFGAVSFTGSGCWLALVLV